MLHLWIRKIFRELAAPTLFSGLVSLTLLSCANILSAKTTGIESGPFAKCWTYNSTTNLSISPSVDASNVFFVDGANRLIAVDLITAHKTWSSEIGGDVVSNLLVTDAAVFAATNAVGESRKDRARTILLSVSKQTGITNWSAELIFSRVVALSAFNGTVVAFGTGGAVAAFNEKGEQIWKTNLAVGVLPASDIVQEQIAFGSDVNQVMSVSAGSGRTKLLVKLDNSPTALLRDSTSRMLIGDERGNLTLFSADGDRIWRFKNGARISFLLSYESEYLAASDDNFLYKLSRGGNVEWKRRLSGRAAGRPRIVGDSVIVSTAGDGNVYVIDLKNGKISERIETDDESSARIAAGSSSNPGFLLLSLNGLSSYARGNCNAK